MVLTVLIPQTELALRGSNGVAFKEGLWFVGQPGRLPARLPASVLYGNLQHLVTLTFKNTWSS